MNGELPVKNEIFHGGREGGTFSKGCYCLRWRFGASFFEKQKQFGRLQVID